MKRLIGTLAAAVLSAFAHEAAACTTYDLDVTLVSGSTYDPVSSASTPLTIQLAPTGPLDVACASVPVVLSGSIADPRPLVFTNGLSRLVADFSPSSDANRVLATLRLTPAARARLVQGQPITLQLGTLDAGQFVRSGDYNSILRVRVGDTDQQVSLEIGVQPAFLFQNSSADGTEDIGLTGDLQSGYQGSTVIFYRTNADVRVTATSDNGGRLVHERGIAFGAIDYFAELDGEQLDLSASPIPLQFQFTRLTLQGKALNVTVPPTEPRYAGQYQDVITLSFMPY